MSVPQKKNKKIVLKKVCEIRGHIQKLLTISYLNDWKQRVKTNGVYIHFNYAQTNNQHEYESGRINYNITKHFSCIKHS